MSMISMAAVGVAAAIAIQAPPPVEAQWTGVRVCLQEQIACGAGDCEPDRIERACDFSALDPQAAAVVRSEMRSFATMLQGTPSASACAGDIARRVERAAQSIATDGPLELMEPYAYTQGSDELATSVEAELYWRAQLEERASGLARERHLTRERGETDECGLPPLVDVVHLRAQNLAFAERAGALEMARAGRLSDPALWGLWFIYNHADLWQSEQSEAAAVFTSLAARDQFSDTLARGLAQRVAAHQPLYSEQQLAGGWPQ